MEINSSELNLLVKEIRDGVVGSVVRNVYQLKDDSVVLKIATESTTYELRLIPGSCLYLTEEAIRKPEEPTNYAQRMRKYLNNARIREFNQLGTERIIVTEMQTRAGEIIRFYAELFPPGNLVLTNEDGKVIVSLREVESKSRTVKPGKIYSPPPSRFSYTVGNPPDNLFTLLRQDSPIIAALSRDLGLGGKYAEELLHRAGVNKEKKVKELTETDKRKIQETLNELDVEFQNPRFLIYIINDKDIIPSVITLKKLEKENYKSIEVQSFNEAIKLSYEYQEKLHLSEEIRKPIEEEMTELKKKIGEKDYVIKQIREKAQQLEEKINLLNQYAGILENIRLAVIQHENPEKYEDIVLTGYNSKNRRFTVKIRETTFDLIVDLSIWKQLGSLYDELKTIKGTINKLQAERDSLLMRIQDLNERLSRSIPDIHAEITDRVSITIEKEFKRLRRFVTSEGFEVLAGKDASSNIALIRKQLNDKDLVFHAEIKGSPVAILKRGSEAGEASIEEAAQFTACFSRAWREGLSSATVYYVKPEQISLSPPPGQFLPKGSFMVYGPRNYLTTELSLAVNIEQQNGKIKIKVIPKLTADKLRIKYVEIRPGNINSVEAARKLVHLFKLSIPKRIEGELIDAVASMIPYGRCYVVFGGHT